MEPLILGISINELSSFGDKGDLLGYGTFPKGRVKKKVIFITLGSDPPLKSDNHFLATRPFLSTFGKKCIFPFENPKTLRKI